MLRTKLALVVLYIVGLFMAKNWISYGLVFLVTIACMAVSHIKPKTLMKGLKPLIIIIVLQLRIYYLVASTIVNIFSGIGDALYQIFIQ